MPTPVYANLPDDSKRPNFPVLGGGAWTLERRLAITRHRNKRHRCGDRCRAKKPGKHHAPGSGRRCRLEYRVEARLVWLRRALRGDRLELAGELYNLDRALACADQARRQVGPFAPAPARIRQLVQLVQTTGPSWGWAFVDARTRGRTFVWLYVPRRSESVARWWCRRVRELLGLLARAVALVGKPSPALRTALKQSSAETVWKGSVETGAELAAAIEAARRRVFPDGAM